jgi:hypothetical protein
VAVLTTKQRKALPAKAFAGPDHSYPVPDKSHAANAKARASQAVKAGRMGAGTEAKIDAKANRVLHGGGHKKQSTTSVDTDRGKFGVKG